MISSVGKRIMLSSNPESPHHMDDQSVLLRLARTYHSSASFFEHCVGITAARWRMLHVIHRMKVCTQTQLMEVIGVDAGLITRTVKDLESKGWVTRQPAPHNNRYTLVALSPAGEKKVAEKTQARELFLERMMAGVDRNDTEVFLRVLDKIAGNVHPKNRQTTDSGSA